MLGHRSRKRSRLTGLFRLGRLLVWAASGAATILFVGYLALPFTLRMVLPGILAERGVPATVASVRVNLFRQEIVLAGLMRGEEAGPSVRWDEVIARVDGRALLQGKLELDNLQLHGAQLNLENLADWNPPINTSATADAKGLGVGFRDIILDDLPLPLLSQLIGQQVVVTRAELRSQADPTGGDAMMFSIAARIDNAPVSIAGSILLDGLKIGVQADIKVDRLALHGMTNLFAGQRLSSLDGRAHLAGKLQASFARDSGPLMLQLSGTSVIDALTATVDGGAVSVGHLSWMGEGDWSWDPQSSLVDLRARGSMELRDGSLAGNASTTPVAGAFETLSWEGQFDHRQGRIGNQGVFTVSGLSADGTFDAGGGQFQVDVDQAGARYQVSGERIDIEDLRGVSVGLQVDDAGQRHVALLDGVSLASIQVDEQGQLTLAGLAVPDLQVRREGADGTSPAFTLEASGVSVETAVGAWSASGPESMELSRAAAKQFTVQLPDTELRLTGLDARQAKLTIGEPLSAQRFSLASGRSRHHDTTQTIDRLQLEGLLINTDLSLSATVVQIARVSAADGEGGDWSASGISGRGLHGEPGLKFDIDELNK